MSRAVMWPCDRCNRHTDARRLRAWVDNGTKRFVCSACYGDLVSEYLTDGKGQPEFGSKVPDGQTELPF